MTISAWNRVFNVARQVGRRSTLPVLAGALAIVASLGGAQAAVCDPVACATKGGVITYSAEFGRNKNVRDSYTFNILSPVGQNQRAEIEIDNFVNPVSGSVSNISSFIATLSADYKFSNEAKLSGGRYTMRLYDKIAYELRAYQDSALTLTITGRAVGAQGGAYSGYLLVTPLPAAALLFAPAVAGLGLFGRHRRRQQDGITAVA